MRGSAYLYNHVVIGYPLQRNAIRGGYLLRERKPGKSKEASPGTTGRKEQMKGKGGNTFQMELGRVFSCPFMLKAEMDLVEWCFFLLIHFGPFVTG